MEVFEAQISTFQDLEHEAAELEAWRRKGPLGKLHNIISWISDHPRDANTFKVKLESPWVETPKRYPSYEVILQDGGVTTIPLYGLFSFAIL